MPVEQLTKRKKHYAEIKPQVDPNKKHIVVIGGNTIDHNFFIEDVGIDRDADVMHLPLHKLTLRTRTTTVGGNGLNLSTALGRLEHHVTLITPAPSKEALSITSKRGVDVLGLHAEDGDTESHKESHVLNPIDYPGDRTILREHLHRNFTLDLQTEIDAGLLDKPDVLVLSSVDGESWKDVYHQTTNYVITHKPFFAVLPGSEQTSIHGAKTTEVQQALENADLICVNKRELTNLLQARDIPASIDMPLLELILLAGREFGYNQQTHEEKEVIISVTDGGNPSLLYTRSKKVLQLEKFDNNSKTPLGAGDAYAGALIGGLTRGLDEADAMIEAAINGYNTTLHLDAQSGHQTPEQIEEQKVIRPDFKPVIIFDAQQPSGDSFITSHAILPS